MLLLLQSKQAAQPKPKNYYGKPLSTVCAAQAATATGAMQHEKVAEDGSWGQLRAISVYEALLHSESPLTECKIN
jgi:hypothetical protein